MSFEPGGRSNKLGNRYEDRFVAWQLLSLLNEDILSVIIEPTGDEEEGVDLWVTLRDGHRQAQQCKARNSSKSEWHVGDLKTRGVLSHLRKQLDSDPSCEFVFVSGIPATSLGDICDSSRNSNGDAEDFYKNLESMSKTRLDVYNQFCLGLELDPSSKTGRIMALDYLERTRMQVFPDDNKYLRFFAELLLTGRADTLVSTLCTYAETQDRLGSTIYADELSSFLETQEILPRNLAHNVLITPRVKYLQREYADLYKPWLINGNIIHRVETIKCYEALLAKQTVIFLYGVAGSGKSGVLYELIQRLEAADIPYLPLRLDRRTPKNTADGFGHDTGLAGSPVFCLDAIAGDRQSVLILDQLDAVRWTSGHSANALNVCRELLEQIRLLGRIGKHISIILSCRTFDMKYDPELKSWCEAQNTLTIEVERLPEIVVRDIVGSDFDLMTGQQQRVLTNTQNLAMWMEIRTTKLLSTFRTATELMKHYWEYRRSQLAKLDIPNDEVNEVIDVMVDWLVSKGLISAPTRIISHCSQRAKEALMSCGVIQEQNGYVSFSHQSYLDYLVATKALVDIDKGGTILDWLGPIEKQTLFKREQLRQALAL